MVMVGGVVEEALDWAGEMPGGGWRRGQKPATVRRGAAIPPSPVAASGGAMERHRRMVQLRRFPYVNGSLLSDDSTLHPATRLTLLNPGLTPSRIIAVRCMPEVSAGAGEEAHVGKLGCASGSCMDLQNRFYP